MKYYIMKIRSHKSRFSYITVILLFFITVIAVAPTVLRNFFPMPHFQVVKNSARENHLKIIMIYAVMKTESGFKTDAVSPKGATGLMQITEKTGQWIADKIHMEEYTAEDLLDPEVNIRMGCWYLSYLLERFNGNKELALAAYNAGEGTVFQWMNSNDIEWRGSEIKSLPYAETEKYLFRVNRIYYVYKSLYPDMDSW